MKLFVFVVVLAAGVAGAGAAECRLAAAFDGSSPFTNRKLTSNSAYSSSCGAALSSANSASTTNQRYAVKGPFTIPPGTCVTVASDTFAGTTSGYNVLLGVYSSNYVANQDPATNLIARGGQAASSAVGRTFSFTSTGASFYLVFVDGVNGGTAAASFTYKMTSDPGLSSGGGQCLRNPPTGITATSYDGYAAVAFTAPTGAAAITGYTATSSPGGRTGSCSASPCTVNGLTNGVAYTFTVTATSSDGTSVTSDASAPVTPTGIRRGPGS